MFLFLTKIKVELNKTEDNKCCFLHFGRGVQDPLSGDQGGPWTPPPPGSAPANAPLCVYHIKVNS